MPHIPTRSPAKIIAAARAQIGYHEGRSSSGSWNNVQKFSAAVPGLEWSNGQPWCATFVSWCARQAGLASLYPVTASTDLGARWFKATGRWSEYPAIGAQIFFGDNGDMNHTGIVTDYDATHVFTIEGNAAGNTHSINGDGVYIKKHARRAARIQGYGLPRFPEGIVSADPARASEAPKVQVPAAPAQSSLPWADRMNPRSYGLGKRNTATAWLKSRLRAHGYKKGLASSPTFGLGTRARVQEFQRAQGWRGRDADGYPGPSTIARLAAPPRGNR